MPKCPILIDGATVVCSVVLDASRHRYTGSVVLRDGDCEQRWFHGLAIARYPDSKDAYLFYCDRDWDTENDSLYSSVTEAITEATQQFGVTQDDWVTELHLARDPDRFRQIAESFQSLLGGEWTAQLDGLDQSYWDLSTSGGVVTVHREHYLGVSAWGPLALIDRVRLHLQTPA
jgi:hypothetical protein